MEELELVLEVLEGGPDGVEAPRLRHHRFVLVGPEILDKHEPSPPLTFPSGSLHRHRRVLVFAGGLAEGLDRFEEVGPGDCVDGVADLVVKVPDPLQQCLDLLHLHLPSHREPIPGLRLGLGFRSRPLSFDPGIRHLGNASGEGVDARLEKNRGGF